MNLETRIKSFKVLGELLLKSLTGSTIYSSGCTGFDVTLRLNDLIINQEKLNPWFTPQNVKFAIKTIAEELTEENLTEWTNRYPGLKENNRPITVGLIMAGNIPLVGFHDFLTVLISGNKLIAKTSSKDYQLIVYLSELLFSINNEFRFLIAFHQDHLKDFDVIIATGSNNSSRYFEYYFGKYPNIIRKNRNSIAILEGDETAEELEGLGNDIFTYFGLGCRNVSKIYIPTCYDISKLVNHWDSFAGAVNNLKYANNYDFNKAVYLVNKEKFIDTGYLLLKESKVLSSPVAVLHYEFYESKSTIEQETEQLKKMIQCKVGRNGIPFGQAQSPKLWDYADGIDTVEFLLKKKNSGNIVN
jgi:hypothetical protein